MPGGPGWVLARSDDAPLGAQGRCHAEEDTGAVLDDVRGLAQRSEVVHLGAVGSVVDDHDEDGSTVPGLRDKTVELAEAHEQPTVLPDHHHGQGGRSLDGGAQSGRQRQSQRHKRLGEHEPAGLGDVHVHGHPATWRPLSVTSVRSGGSSRSGSHGRTRGAMPVSSLSSMRFQPGSARSSAETTARYPRGPVSWPARCRAKRLAVVPDRCRRAQRHGVIDRASLDTILAQSETRRRGTAPRPVARLARSCGITHALGALAAGPTGFGGRFRIVYARTSISASSVSATAHSPRRTQCLQRLVQTADSMCSRSRAGPS